MQPSARNHHMVQPGSGRLAHSNASAPFILLNSERQMLGPNRQSAMPEQAVAEFRRAPPPRLGYNPVAQQREQVQGNQFRVQGYVNGSPQHPYGVSMAGSSGAIPYIAEHGPRRGEDRFTPSLTVPQSAHIQNDMGMMNLLHGPGIYPQAGSPVHASPHIRDGIMYNQNGFNTRAIGRAGQDDGIIRDLQRSVMAGSPINIRLRDDRFAEISDQSKEYPETGLFFGSAEAAFQAIQGPEWKCDVQDPTIPTSDAEKAQWVFKLVKAFLNLEGINDKDSGPVLKARWFGGKKIAGKDHYYGLREIEEVCWRILETAYKIHTEGVAWVPIRDPETLAKAEKSRDLSFEERLDALIHIFTHFKNRCDKMMKGGDILATVLCPKDAAKTAANNRHANDDRQWKLFLGRAEYQRQQAQEGTSPPKSRRGRKPRNSLTIDALKSNEAPISVSPSDTMLRNCSTDSINGDLFSAQQGSNERSASEVFSMPVNSPHSIIDAFPVENVPIKKAMEQEMIGTYLNARPIYESDISADSFVVGHENSGLHHHRSDPDLGRPQSVDGIYNNKRKSTRDEDDDVLGDQFYSSKRHHMG